MHFSASLLLYMCCIIIYRVTWAKHEGIKYQKGGCVRLVTDVFVVDGRVLLEVQLLQNNGFDEHLHAHVFFRKHYKYIWSF